MAVSYDTSVSPSYIAGINYDPVFDRRRFDDALRPGIIDLGDFLVSAGTGMGINIAAGKALVSGLNVADQGMYRIKEPNANVGGITIPASDLSKPRIEQIVGMVQDADHDTSGQRKSLIKLLTGVATTGATLANRTGAADLTTLGDNTKSVELLADILVPAGATTAAGCTIRDRRRLTVPKYTIVTAGLIANNTGASASGNVESDLITTQTIPGCWMRNSDYDLTRPTVIRLTIDGLMVNTVGSAQTMTFKFYLSRGNNAVVLWQTMVNAFSLANGASRGFRFEINLYCQPLVSSNAAGSWGSSIRSTIGASAAGGTDGINSLWTPGAGPPSLSPTDTNLNLNWKVTAQTNTTNTAMQAWYGFAKTEMLYFF